MLSLYRQKVTLAFGRWASGTLASRHDSDIYAQRELQKQRQLHRLGHIVTGWVRRSAHNAFSRWARWGLSIQLGAAKASSQSSQRELLKLRRQVGRHVTNNLFSLHVTKIYFTLPSHTHTPPRFFPHPSSSPLQVSGAAATARRYSTGQ